MKIGAVINNSSGVLPPEEAKDRIESIKENLKNRVAEGCLSVVEGSEVEKEVKRLLSMEVIGWLRFHPATFVSTGITKPLLCF